ncbi:hypothetical protein Calow_0343 [Caldicellulosiruptor owensensis OL]|uniref:Uncharacterized protein n=1 Tax=Caldicellulosiruptor owensensis (strain ATCC 700167 / DSM 13100 / OL) TaxID=632518 RepID=E4Q3H4_CALOW|nr:hypothetical protein [Caldicellulosiruptor owensensis]ADQ03934.1 hypothetical protein Calow_0343 [Caldicellulosiruptor owensensis OL]
MKRKVICIHIIFLIIMVSILFFLYKNYSLRKISFKKASENVNVKLVPEIQSAVKLTDYIISNFDKDGFSEKNILLLEYKSKVIYESIRHILSIVEIDKDHDYFIRIRYSNKIVIKSKKDIYNELLLYHDLFSKLDINNKENYKGIELFNKIIEKLDTKKAELIVYPDERT